MSLCFAFIQSRVDEADMLISVSLKLCSMGREASGFTSSPLKEVLLWILIAIKNPSLSSGFEPMNLGSSGMRADHYTTENKLIGISLSQYRLWRIDRVCSQRSMY